MDFFNALRQHSSRMDGMLAHTRAAEVVAYWPERHMCKVKILPEGNVTGWIPVGAVSVGKGVGMVCPPVNGQHVIVQPIQGDGEQWAVIARTFTTQDTPPLSTATEKPIQQGEVALVTKGAVIHMIGDTVHIQAAHIASKGEWKHDGILHTTGDITSDKDVIASGVSLKNHVHTGVKGGDGTSGKPQQ